MSLPSLPVDDAMPDLLDALRSSGMAVLQAPPGAGKTTRVPLAILQAGLVNGRILMLEPRRLATRAAAERMAETLGEKPGQTVGYRMRGESKVGPQTRIEVVTEGILTRMIQSDPDLPGVAVVIFDEFHERSLNADLGLALALELRIALRDDLNLLVMSATLDADPVAALMGGAPVITSQGRAYPVETRWLERPLKKGARVADTCAELVHQAVQETDGGVLVFLPGEGEIRRVQARLNGRLPEECVIRPLFGALPFAEQRAAIQPAQKGRKIVLATSIAETSLTIQDVRVVVDAGLARRARFDPSSGMSRLVTETVSRAEADQRRGRAGRVAEGWCYRMWAQAEEGRRPPYPPAEIESADLTGLALELAMWGVVDPADLPFLTAPNAGALAEARALLAALGALDAQGRVTDHGRTLAALPLHPRLAHMMVMAGSDGALVAALLAERDPLGRGAPVDLSLRLEALRDLRAFQDRRPWPVNRAGIERIKSEAKRLRAKAKSVPKGAMSVAAMTALAYPDRIGLRRKGDTPRWVLSSGTGVTLPPEDPLSGARLIVVTETDGDRREAKIRQAVELAEAELRDLYADQITWRRNCVWDKRTRRVEAREQECLGALILNNRHWRDAPAEDITLAALDGIRDLGLPMTNTARRFLARRRLVQDDTMPDLSEDTLMDTLKDWLLPHLPPLRNEAEIKAFDILPALRALFDWDQIQRLDRLAPAHWHTPLGRRVPIDYAQDSPTIEVRLQEMFGTTTHPTVGSDRIPLRITLLSPAQRPVQVTTDIPGFWATSYADVRKDMRGRYPKHPWPEDPSEADPTLRAKRRK